MYAIRSYYEIFPNKVRGTAMSIATLALWIACFALTYTFPLLNAGLGASGSFFAPDVLTQDMIL